MVRNLYLFFFVGSFLFVIVHLNFNVRSFKKAHEVQTLTLELQALKKSVHDMELDYLSKTKLDNVYRIASEELGMIRQEKVRVFSNRDVELR